jgi:hypothetical protein
MTVIKAIETSYGGYRFRSRLEARWAVFFDECELEWDYEAQGYEMMTRIGKVRYLPDFWLDCGQWAEVKGFLNIESAQRLCAIAETLTECGKGNDLVVLGDVPRPRSILWPVQLHFHKKLWAVPWEPHSVGCPLERPRVAVEPTAEMTEHLISGFPFGRPDWAEDGVERARRARFEWGESG